jgi:proline iminopeptidase
MKTKTSIVFAVTLIVLAGCTPSEPPVEESAPPGIENGSYHVTLNGFDIHYEVHGQGPVLMTLPNSWGLSLEGLRGLYRPLEDNLTMVYFDPRGMGESSPVVDDTDMGMAAVRADFQALRQHLGLETVNAIGWSNGAMNLILLAAEHPETIETAIFLHGAAYFSEEDQTAYAEQYPEVIAAWGALIAELQNPDLTDNERTARMRDMWLNDWFPVSFADRASASGVLNSTFEEAEFSWAHGSYSQTDQADFDARSLLPQITARSLVIGGAHDSIPSTKGEEMTAAIADAEFVLFESSGHYAPVEEPEAFESLVLRYLGVS